MEIGHRFLHHLLVSFSRNLRESVGQIAPGNSVTGRPIGSNVLMYSPVYRQISFSFVVALIPLVAVQTSGAGAFQFELADEEQVRLTEDDWRSAIACGPNALYLFMKSRGWEGDLQQLYDKAPIDSKRGTNLQQLADAAVSLGVSAGVVQADLSDLRYLQLPLITHHDGESATGPLTGHFYFVSAIGRVLANGQEVVAVIDPVSLAEKDIPTEEFIRSWTGYILSDGERRGITSVVLTALADSLVLSLASSAAVLLSLCFAAWAWRGGAPIT